MVGDSGEEGVGKEGWDGGGVDGRDVGSECFFEGGLGLFFGYFLREFLCFLFFALALCCLFFDYSAFTLFALLALFVLLGEESARGVLLGGFGFLRSG